MDRKVNPMRSSLLNWPSLSRLQLGMVHPDGSPPFSFNAVLR